MVQNRTRTTTITIGLHKQEKEELYRIALAKGQDISFIVRSLLNKWAIENKAEADRYYQENAKSIVSTGNHGNKAQ